MPPTRTVLLVDSDAAYGRALAIVLRRQGDRVTVVRTRTQALTACRRASYDLAIVDLFVDGGGAELARELSRSVPRLLLSLGARLGREEVLEAALGFPVLRKAALPALLKAPDASSNGGGFVARRPESPLLSRAASERAPALAARARHRARRLH